jgi:hypothetical protein
MALVFDNVAQYGTISAHRAKEYAAVKRALDKYRDDLEHLARKIEGKKEGSTLRVVAGWVILVLFSCLIGGVIGYLEITTYPENYFTSKYY